ncbi:MAG: hypothetical protein AB7I34_23800 [Rhizobiaceae bacterium]
MIMRPAVRKFALAAHVTSSVGTLGAVAGFLALAIVGLVSLDVQVVRSAYIAMDLTARFVIVPCVFASLLTGLIQSLGTSWGLFRHYWILAKLLLTIVVTLVLLLQLELIGYLADAASKTTFSSADLHELRRSPVIHAAGGLLVLLLPVALSIYKPRGMTRYGWHRRQERVSRR